MRSAWSVWTLGFLVFACKHGDAESQSSAPDATDSGQDAGGPADVGPDAGTARTFQRSVFYEVFVRSFADSDGDGRGDFRGLTEKLDYLNDGDPTTTRDLGINGIWLMPIHPSPSYHGYDVTDYQGINPQYGTMADFEAFLAAAKARGIAVIIDLVLNHSSAEHPWFVSAQGGPSAPKRDWYNWRTDDPGWTQPWGTGHVWHALGGAYFYGIFWSGMPDLNLSNPAVEDEMVDVMRFWLGKGVDGFRVDAARYLFESGTGGLFEEPATHAFIQRVKAKLAPDYPDAFLVAEAWTALPTVATYAGQGREYDLAFGFDTASAIMTATKDGLKADLLQAQRSAEQSYADRRFEAPFLTNHDMVRVMRAFEGDAAKMRVAAAALFAVPGTPFLYYGEELGLMGNAGTADEDKRTPMRWTATGPSFGFTTGTPWRASNESPGVDVASESADPASLLSLYRQLVRLRLGTPALAIGGASRPTMTGGGPGTFAILRSEGPSRVLWVVNFRNEAASALTVEVAGAPRALLVEGVDTPTSDGSKLTFGALAPRSFGYYAIE
jgi:alpha-amylase